MMFWDLGSKRSIRGGLHLVVAAVAVAFFACDGCAGCGEPPAAPDAGRVAPPPATPDVSVEEEPKVDLALATEMAEADAERLAVRAGDSARAVAGEIEAASPKAPPRPKIRESEPETGKLQKAELNKVFNAHADAMKSCYERSLKKSPGLQGKVRLELLIRASGEVGSANARAVSLRDNNVTSCMERQAMTMKFPAPDGGAVRVNKTYSFTPDF